MSHDTFVYGHILCIRPRSREVAGKEDTMPHLEPLRLRPHRDDFSLWSSSSVDLDHWITEAKVHELLMDADVFINGPVLKHHSSSMLTVGMKNLMGVVWDRG